MPFPAAPFFRLNGFMLIVLLSLSACGGGGGSSSGNSDAGHNQGGASNPSTQPVDGNGGNGGGGSDSPPLAPPGSNPANPHTELVSKKIVFVFNGITAQSCSGDKLKELLQKEFSKRGYEPAHYQAQTGDASLNCNGRGEYCESIPVGEQGANDNKRCLVKFDLPYLKGRESDAFSKRKIVLLYKKISPASCVHSELKSELENLFLAKGYQATDIIAQAESDTLSCNAYLDNSCTIAQGEDTTASNQDKCLIGFNLPVNGDEGSSADPFMSRNTVFILSNVTETTCNSQRLKNNIVNAMGNNGYLAQNMLTRPVNESLTCNAYLGKGCELIDGGEPGANTIDHCLVGVDLTKSPNAGGSGSNSSEVNAAIRHWAVSQYINIWVNDAWWNPFLRPMLLHFL